MATVVLGTSMSLDGFINDKNGSVGPLYEDFEAMHDSPVLKDDMEKTKAVVMGRHTFDMAADPNWYVKNYEFQVPIFVVTSHPPEEMPKQDKKLTFTFVTDGVESAIAQARAAAGKGLVTVVGGAALGQQLLFLGLVDELQIDIMPIILGQGLRFFGHLDTSVKLKKKWVQEFGSRTTIRFEVVK